MFGPGTERLVADDVESGRVVDVYRHLFELETTQRHWAELSQDINCDKLEGLRDVVFRVFRVRLLRAFPEGADVARQQFARKLDTVARHTPKNVQVPAVNVFNATVPEISRLRTKGHSGGAVTVGKGV